MLKLKKVAITGDIGAGKSSVCEIFQQLGSYTVDADAIVASLLMENELVRQKVIDLLGSSICDDNQKIRRENVAKKVFQQDPHHLQKLEEILHPYVFKEISTHFQQAKKSHAKLFVAEIALLFEVNREKDYDYTIYVTAGEETRKKRTEESQLVEYEKRQERLLPSEKKQKQADFVIHNDGSKERLEQEVSKLYQLLTR